MARHKKKTGDTEFEHRIFINRSLGKTNLTTEKPTNTQQTHPLGWALTLSTITIISGRERRPRINKGPRTTKKTVRPGRRALFISTELCHYSRAFDPFGLWKWDGPITRTGGLDGAPVINMAPFRGRIVILLPRVFSASQKKHLTPLILRHRLRPNRRAFQPFAQPRQNFT